MEKGAKRAIPKEKNNEFSPLQSREDKILQELGNERRDWGSYYTPPQITRYLAEHTIIPYVFGDFTEDISFTSLTNQISIYLVSNQQKLDIFQKMLFLKILDPACGGGAFLEEVAQILISLWELIFPFIIESFTDTFGHSNFVRSELIEYILGHNLYGVDLMLEAVNLCRDRLRKWAGINDKFQDSVNGQLFNQHIRSGNSLIGFLWITKNFEHASDKKSLDNLFYQGSISSNLRDEFPFEFFQQIRPLHWGEIFPEVGIQGGFNIIVGNPPWNAVKPFEKEFFAQYDSRLTRYTVDKIEARQIIDQLISDNSKRQQWEKYVKLVSLESQIFRKSYIAQSDQIFGRTISGDLNYYKLFLERIFGLLQAGGQIGIVIPSAFYSDAGGKGLRRLYFENSKIREILSFENRLGIFPDVHRSYKFILFLTSKCHQTNKFRGLFCVRDLTVLKHVSDIALILDWGVIKKSAPESYSIPEIKSQHDLQILSHVFYHHPLLRDNHKEIGTVEFRREFDMSLDIRYFSERTSELPLWEGKMIEQYTPYFNSAIRYYVEKEKAIKKLYGTSLIGHDFQEFRLAFRAVAANTNRRSMIASILPKNVVCGNSLIVLRLYNDEQRLILENRLIYLCGVFNSILFDYLLRLRINTNLNMFFIYQMPVPVPREPWFTEIVHEVLVLTANWPAFEPLRKKYGIQGEDLSMTQRILIMGKIDAAVAKLYDISSEDLHYIYDQFHQCDPSTEGQLRQLELAAFMHFK